MKPPKLFVAALRAYDPFLRLLWGEASRCWLIARKMPERSPEFLAMLRPPDFIAAHEDHALVHMAHDRYRAMQQGYFPLFTIPASQIHETDRLMVSVRACDAEAQGGFQAINDALDREHERWWQERVQQRKGFSHDAAQDAYERMRWLEKQRIAVPEAITSEAP